MFRWASIITASVFLLWLIPLGLFIAPSKEKLLCGGQRAVCLCTCKTVKVSSPNAISGMTVKAASGVQEEQNTPGGGIHAFVAFHHPYDLALNKMSLFVTPENFYTNPSLASFDHVPKA